MFKKELLKRFETFKVLNNENTLAPNPDQMEELKRVMRQKYPGERIFIKSDKTEKKIICHLPSASTAICLDLRKFIIRIFPHFGGIASEEFNIWRNKETILHGKDVSEFLYGECILSEEFIYLAKKYYSRNTIALRLPVLPRVKEYMTKNYSATDLTPEAIKKRSMTVEEVAKTLKIPASDLPDDEMFADIITDFMTDEVKAIIDKMNPPIISSGGEIGIRTEIEQSGCSIM